MLAGAATPAHGLTLNGHDLSYRSNGVEYVRWSSLTRITNEVFALNESWCHKREDQRRATID